MFGNLKNTYCRKPLIFIRNCCVRFCSHFIFLIERYIFLFSSETLGSRTSTRHCGYGLDDMSQASDVTTTQLKYCFRVLEEKLSGRPTPQAPTELTSCHGAAMFVRYGFTETQRVTRRASLPPNKSGYHI